MIKCLSFFSSLILAASFACGSDGGSPAPEPGLHVEESVEGRVAGDFVGDDATVHFDLLQNGSDMALQVSDASERPLFRIESTPQRFVFDYFAGGLTLSGPASALNTEGPLFGADGASPPEQLEVAGDIAVLSDFRDLPEAGSIEELMAALGRDGHLSVPLGLGYVSLEAPEPGPSAGVEARACAINCPATMPICSSGCRIKTIFSGSFTKCRRACFRDILCDTCF